MAARKSKGTGELTPREVVAIGGTVRQFTNLMSGERFELLMNCLAPKAQTVMLRNLRDIDVWYRPTSIPGGPRGIAIFVGDDGLRTLRASNDADANGTPMPALNQHMMIVAECPADLVPDWLRHMLEQAGVAPLGGEFWPSAAVKERGKGGRAPIVEEWELADDVLLAANDLVDAALKFGLAELERMLHPAPDEAWLLTEFPDPKVPKVPGSKVTTNMAWVRPKWPT